MSQYVSVDGMVNDWHFAHLSRFALGNAGLVFTEATAVSKNGRRTHGDLGLWDDTQIEGLRRISGFLHDQGSLAGVQLGHAGRKASERRPWHGETPVNEEDQDTRGEAPWQTVAPSALPYAENWHQPRAMSEAEIGELKEDFRAASRRADVAGFDVIEVYAAHGFLLHQFYSPIANERQDRYGGSFEDRIRLPLEVAESIRSVWPENKALFFRISATDWIDGGWQVEDSIELAKRLKPLGVDLVDCSSGGIGGLDKQQKIPLGPAFQADLAQSLRREAGIMTMAVGLIWQASIANEIIASEKADLVALGREMLNNPNWALHAARELEVDSEYSFLRDSIHQILKIETHL